MRIKVAKIRNPEYLPDNKRSNVKVGILVVSYPNNDFPQKKLYSLFDLFFDLRNLAIS